MTSQQSPLNAPAREAQEPSLPVAQCIIRPSDPRPLCNRPMRELLQALCLGASPPRQRAIKRRFWRLLTPLAQATQNGKTPIRSRFSLKTEHGATLLEITCRPPPVRNARKGSRCFVLARSQSSNKQTFLRAERQAIQHHPWPMLLLSPSGETLHANRAAMRLSGSSAHVAAGHLDSWVHPDEGPMVRGLWQEACAHGKPLQMIARVKGTHGSYATRLILADPQRDPAGRLSHWLCTAIEMQGHQWLGAMDVIGEAEGVSNSFLTVASHELRTPLTSLQLNLQLALQRLRRHKEGHSEDTGIENMVCRSLKQTHRLIEVVSDILDASRIHMNKLQLRQTKVDLRQSVLDTLALFDRPFAEVGCRVTVHLQEDIVGFWDKGRIEQVFFDLLANVLKHAPGSHVLLTARVDGELATVTVTDDGPGIEAKQHQRIFGRFGRAAECRGISGLGLGLYLCRRIVENHGGTLEVSSQPGQGATFVARLPVGGGHDSAAPALSMRQGCGPRVCS